MARIIRLTESDLTRLVRRVIKEEELPQSNDEKDCVKQIRKLYISNGFKEVGNYGDGELHMTRLTYQKRTPGVTYSQNWSENPASVYIELTDSHIGSHFSIRIIAKSDNLRDDKIRKLDPKVINLIKNTKYKDDRDTSQDLIVVDNYNVNCETAKTELINTIKPLLQSLSQLGYKRI